MSEEEIIKEIESLSPSEQAIQGILDLYNKEKEQNRVSINSINDLMKECNQENKRCAELAIELDKEKEKNKELEEENDTLRVIKKGFLKGQHSNCVQKEKIQEKIKNIKERRDIDGACETALAGFQREAKLDVLQELLEERN